MTGIEDRENGVYYIGETNYRNKRTRFGIRKKDRRSHMYIIGKTGVGKSTLIKNLIIQDLKRGNGLALLDPHGDLAEEILDYIPEGRENDVIYFNPADRDYPVGFNMFDGVNPANRHIVASELVSVFKKLWADSWGPRLEHILRNSILSLAEYPGTTLLDLPRILVDADFRKTVLMYVTDKQVKEFWVKEFEKYPANFRAEAIAPIQNKVGAFLTNPLTRNILGQKRSSFNMREIMDSRKILIANLAKGKIGEDTSMLLGSLLVTKIEQAALSRADIPEEKRRDFYLYIDEFHTFTTESFANMLPEARKYRLCLILVHQYLEQIDERTVAAVFGNAGTVITFRMGAMDAEYLAREFYPDFRVDDFINLPAYHIYLRLMIDGVVSNPFSAVTLPSSDEKSFIKEKVTNISRKLYGKL